MKKGKFGIAVFSLVILGAILLAAVQTEPNPVSADPLVIQVGTETLKLWSEDGQTCYGFLPSCAQSTQVQFLPLQDAVTLDGQRLPLTWEQLKGDGPYSLSWQENGTQHSTSLYLLTSSGVASMHLDTQSGTMDYIHEEKGNAERGSLRLYDREGTLAYSGSLETIRGRGNSTWVVHDKKPYSLKLTEKADLLDMGAAKDWVLLADALDTSAMRNKIVYDFSALAGLPYTPECHWTELYLNGTYAGLYLLSEKVEADPQRIPLSSDGSLICMDRDIRIEEDAAPYIVTGAGQYLQIREGTDIGALKQKVQAMEDAILSGEGWQEHLDLTSWVKKYLVEEIFGSYDAGFQSQYFYCDDTTGQGKIFAGPVWDYDSSLGNPQVWALNNPQGLYACRPEAMVGYPTPWFSSLYQQAAFRSALQEEYRTVFLPLLEALPETVRSYGKEIRAAFDRNSLRWAVETEGAAAEAEAILDYMQQRIRFLSELWLEEKEFCIVRLQEGESSGYYGYYAVEPGTCFTDLPEKEGADFLGWYREDSGIPFNPAEPVYEDIFLYPSYGHPSEAAEAEEGGLKDLILECYHYVPLAVLVLMGLILLPLSIRKSRTAKKKESSSV